MIKLEALRVFTTVAECGNIKDAADQLGRTPSAISMTLKQLEADIGERLFNSDRKSSLTALGEFLLKTSRRQLSSFDRSVNSIRAFADGRLGELTLASVPSVAVNLLPEILSSFAASYPGVEIELFDIDSASVAEMVHAGKAEAGIAGRPPDADTFTFEPLFRDHFNVVCRSDSPLASAADGLSWDDLSGQNLIVNGASEMITAPEYRMLAQQTWMKVQNTSSLFAMTLAGLGVTLLPALATKSMPEGIVALALDDPSATREVGIVSSRSHSPAPAAVRFLEHFHDVLPAHLRRLGLRIA